MISEVGRPEDSRPGLSCETFTSFEAITHLRDEWDRFVEHMHGDIYLTFDWCRVWWQFYSLDRELHILLFRNDTRLIGILPLFIDTLGHGPLAIRLAKVVGSDFGCTLAAPVVHPAWSHTILTCAVTALFAQHRCDALLLSSVSEQAQCWPALRDIVEAPPATVGAVWDRVRCPHSVFFLPSSFDAYLQSLKRVHRANYRKELNRLTRAGALDVTITSHGPGLDEAFVQFSQMHQAQWMQKGQGGHFVDWPHALRFHKALVAALSARNRVRLLAVVQKGRVLVYEYCFVCGETLHNYLVAQCTGPEWHGISLGRIGHCKVVEYAIGEHLAKIEDGPGHYVYKQQLGATEIPLHSIMLTRPGLTAHLRCRLFRQLARVYSAAYYKIWFKRVRPRLRLRPGPLSSAWIRMRI